MTGVATIVCLALAVVVMAVAGWRASRDRPVERTELIAAGVLELAVLVYVALRVVDLARGHETSGLGIVVVYLVGIAVVVPVAGFLALAEQSRWGPVVLAFGALVVCVLFARLNQLWSPGG
ncbi:hypothetical protein ACXR2U_14905 [Jatrophihabitans sp. YIM 134969]